MPVKRRKVDVQLEKQILTGMIVSDKYLREVQNIYRPELLEITFGPIVAKWCLDYYQQYEKAPGKFIQDLFENWSKSNPDPELVDYIEDFLNTLSDEFQHGDKFNAEYLIDKTVVQFKTIALKQLSENISDSLKRNNTEEAESVLTDFRKIERITCTGIDPYDNKDAIQAAFEEKQEPLFRVPGALGRLWNGELTRDAFIGLMAPEKRGKTWWLMFLGECAHRARCNVAFFSAGDMTQSGMVRRQHISLARKSDLKKYCGTLYIPVLDCEKNQKDICDERKRSCRCGVYEDGIIVSLEDAPTKYKPCTYCIKENPRQFKGAVWHTIREPVEPLKWREAYRNGITHKKKLRAKGFKLATYSNNTLTVSGIANQLEVWEQVEGFVPDVILIDYADILASEDKRMELRHQQNEIWKNLRKLAQDYHACVITATQADAASYYKESMDRSNFSEDKRKFAHATAVYALNQTQDEKRIGIMRIGPLVIREDDYDERYNVHVLQCLQIGAPYLASF